MSVQYQRTLKNAVTIEGIGVHSGAPARITLRPAAPDTGIIFIRTDLEGRPEIPARSGYVHSTQMATTLAKGSAKVATVEHLMSALYGLGVDNVLAEIDGPEMPILDGSSMRFFEAIRDAGIQTQEVARTRIVLKKKVQLRVGDKWAVAEPSEGFDVKVSIEWDHPAIGYQEFHYVEGETRFEDVGAARTFGFLGEVEMLKKMGLARGGSLENAIVLDESKVLNPDGLRFPDEFVRHKVLDALGDFKLAGTHFVGSFRMHRPGHELHTRLVEKILSDPANYDLVTTVRPAAATGAESAMGAEAGLGLAMPAASITALNR